MLAISHAREAAIVELLTLRKNMGEPTTPFDILTEEEIPTVKERNYTTATLSGRAVSLLPYSTGIYLVAHADDISNEIIPTRVSHNALFSGQDSRSMEGSAYYSPFDQELRIFQFAGDCDVLVQYVKAGEYFTEDEDFKIPAGLQDQVVKMAIEILMNQQKEEDMFTDAKNA